MFGRAKTGTVLSGPGTGACARSDYCHTTAADANTITDAYSIAGAAQGIAFRGWSGSASARRNLSGA